VISLDRPIRPHAHLLERQRVLREPVECSPCHLKVCPIDHRCERLAPRGRSGRAARRASSPITWLGRLSNAALARRRVALANGCFDVLHGSRAPAWGSAALRRAVVALNSDDIRARQVRRARSCSSASA
jgi:hypothetical protein